MTKDVDNLLWDVIKDIEVESIIDVGTGTNGVVGLHYIEKKNIKRKYAIDIYYIKPLPSDWTCIIMDGRDMYKKFGDKSFDIITAYDFIEHLNKEDGIKWLRDAEKIARKLIFLFTPISKNGEIPPSPSANLRPENIYEEHQSGWTYEEFEKLGFKTGKNDPQNMWKDTNIISWKIL
jgi:hypothetical protein